MSIMGVNGHNQGAPRKILTCAACGADRWVPAYRLELVAGVVYPDTSSPAPYRCAGCGLALPETAGRGLSAWPVPA